LSVGFSSIEPPWLAITARATAGVRLSGFACE